MFGNTQKVAEAVAVGLRDSGADVTVAEVGTTLLSDLAHADLLVLAAPTHALALSSPESRADAVARGAEPQHALTGLREWLTAVTSAPRSDPPVVAVFDTRMSRVRHWPGSAGKQMARKLERNGFSVLDRETFYVLDVAGPLVDGELDRANQWGRALAGLLSTRDGAGHAGR
jgi:flavorubredoxin